MQRVNTIWRTVASGILGADARDAAWARLALAPVRCNVRGLTKLLGGLAALAVLLSAAGYAVYAANGILDEVHRRDVRATNDRLMVGTGTALAIRLTTVSREFGAVRDALAQTPGPTEAIADVPGTDWGDDAVITETVPVGPTADEVSDGDVMGSQASSTAQWIQVIASATATASASRTASATSAPSLTPTETLTATPTASSTPTASMTASPAPTLTHTPTASPSMTPTRTPSPTATVTVRPTATPIPTNTPRPTVTPIPTNTPRATTVPLATATSAVQLAAPTATATYVIEGTYAAPLQTPIVPIPAAMPLLDVDPDVTHFLLLGSDTAGGGAGLTDVMIIVSVNRRVGTVAMWHLPRDLFVYIPNYTMDRLNLVYALGEGSGYPGGGFGLLRETIRYNLGIEVEHYARVDFDGFMQIVEQLGGLDISVDCAIADWRLKSPDLDAAVEDNWEYYTLPIGRQRLSPYMALWYARSRKTTNDLDRGRRQMDVLRAMWYQARQQGVFAQVTQLWPQAMQIVRTDLTLTDALGLVPLAVGLDMSAIARYSGQVGTHYTPIVTPDDGREVLLPNREALIPLIEDFLTPPTANRLGRQALLVEIVDASNFGLGFDRVAADRLAWEGFRVQSATAVPTRLLDLTVITDFTGQSKGSALQDIMRVLRIGEGQVVSQPDPNRSVDFRVEIGRAYNACVYGGAENNLSSGPPIPTETPGPVSP